MQRFNFKRTLATFRVPKRNTKYEPVEFDKWQYMGSKRSVLVELDERERTLCDQYVSLMASDALLFLHAGNMKIQETNEVRKSLRKAGIGLQFINSRLFKGQLLNTRYENIIPLMSGTTYVAYPLGSTEDSHEVDPVEFVSKFLNASRKMKNIMVLGGKVEKDLLGPQALQQFSRLPCKQQIIGQLLGTIQYPAQTMTQILQRNQENIVTILNEHKKQINIDKQQQEE